MPLTVRQVVEDHLYRRLRKEDAVIPFTDADKRDPMPDALNALNGTLQFLAVTSPLFASKQMRSVLLRPPATISTDMGFANFQQVESTSWEGWMVGCRIEFSGIREENRIVSISGTTATLQNCVPSGAFTGKSATVYCDSADLAADVIKVHDPVRFVNGPIISPAIGRGHLSAPVSSRDDYGRRRRAQSGCENAYYIESVAVSGVSHPVLRLMLKNHATVLGNVEFVARVSLGYFTQDDVFADGSPDDDPGTPIPVPSDFVESIFLPLAVMRFYESPELKDADIPQAVKNSAQAAMQMLAAMSPQANKPAIFTPGFR